MDVIFIKLLLKDELQSLSKVKNSEKNEKKGEYSTANGHQKIIKKMMRKVGIF